MMDFHVLLYLRHIFQTDPPALWKPENMARIVALSKELSSDECHVYIIDLPSK